MKKTWLLCLGLGLAFAAAAGTSTAAPIARVIIVETKDMPAYLREVENLRQKTRKAGLKTTLRVWQVRFGGADAGTTIVTVEMPDLATLARLDAMLKSDAEYAAIMSRIGKIRQIKSDSILEELTQ